MKMFNGIVGVLAIFGAIYCIFWPEAAFLNAGWIVALVTFLWGVCATVNYAINQTFFHKNDGEMPSAILGLVFGVGACIISVLAMTSETFEALFLVLILILLMAFLALVGVKNIATAAQFKHSKQPKGWISRLIFGIVQISSALVGVLHWVITGGDDFTNILIGLLLGLFGVTLIATIFARNRLDLWGEL